MKIAKKANFSTSLNRDKIWWNLSSTCEKSSLEIWSKNINKKGSYRRLNLLSTGEYMIWECDFDSQILSMSFEHLLTLWIPILVLVFGAE